MFTSLTRPTFTEATRSDKAPLPFSGDEYARRLTALRAHMLAQDLEAVVLTSMHNVAYFSGFLYCSFGRPYACVVTGDRCITVSAGIDGETPFHRSLSENLIYTDWNRDSFQLALRHLLGPVRRLGFEADEVNVSRYQTFQEAFANTTLVDIAPATMAQRMLKSREEIALIREGARIADIGGAALHGAIREGASELEIAMLGREAMEHEIARTFPDSELRDTWVWLQSGANTDGAHNPITTRRLRRGDILSLNTFPMISGYYTALERTAFLGQPDAASLALWEANVGAHELGLSLIAAGRTCASICHDINAYLDDLGLLQYRSFGYGHSFGVLSHYYGRESGLELREDVDTVLEPGMVVSMEPMLRVPQGAPGAGGYREHDIVVITESAAENLTGFPYGPAHNVIDT